MTRRTKLHFESNNIYRICAVIVSLQSSTKTRQSLQVKYFLLKGSMEEVKPISHKNINKSISNACVKAIIRFLS